MGKPTGWGENRKGDYWRASPFDKEKAGEIPPWEKAATPRWSAQSSVRLDSQGCLPQNLLLKASKNILSSAMSLTVEQISEEALSLPSEARALLADRLVESLDPAEDGYIKQLWSAEAIRRRDDVRSGRVQTIPGNEALARVRNSVAR